MSLEALAEDLGRLSGDPLTFVKWAFPWGEPGTELERFLGPESWQVGVLEDIRDGLLTPNQAIQLATASGHGVGKSALVAWIILWGISTFEDARGVVTANTETQLKTKTWAELGKWHRLFIASELFTLTATALFHKARERTWRIDMVPWSERNTEAFAGLHNQGRRIILIMDEASAIEDVIWETAEGALTDADTQILWLVFGNPTRNSGRFKACFDGPHAQFWKSRQVDSRTVSFTNKSQFTKWLEVYGEDDDFFRIRVRGVFPRQGEMEFFSASDVDAAMLREVTYSLTDPLALGVDVARFGVNNSVIFARKGRDARSIPRKVFNGMNTVTLAEQVLATAQSLHADGIFIDGGGVGGGVVDNVRNMRLHCFDVQFGGKADRAGAPQGTESEKYANKRAEMYGACRGWLRGGCLPNDPTLREQLLGITYTFDKKDRIILTSKEVMMRDGKPSPDDLDALCLTFAYALAPHAHAGGEHLQPPSVVSDYDPFSPEHLEIAA